MSSITRIICLCALAGMFIYLAYGFFFENSMEAVLASMAPFWGKFVWTDITVTFLLMTTIIVSLERNPWVGVLMFVLMNLTGSVAIAAWLLWRGPDLFARIKAGDPRPPKTTADGLS